jgi:hypothetical protein
MSLPSNVEDHLFSAIQDRSFDRAADLHISVLQNQSEELQLVLFEAVVMKYFTKAVSQLEIHLSGQMGEHANREFQQDSTLSLTHVWNCYGAQDRVVFPSVLHA